MPNPYEEIAVQKNDQFEFNSSDCIRWLEKTGKRLFGSHFRIYPQDRRLIFTLLVYAIADRETTLKQGLRLEKLILTHVTTNLTALELETKYGNRIRSRMREMFNLVSFDKDSKDKRV